MDKNDTLDVKIKMATGIVLGENNIIIQTKKRSCNKTTRRVISFIQLKN